MVSDRPSAIVPTWKGKLDVAGLEWGFDFALYAKEFTQHRVGGDEGFIVALQRLPAFMDLFFGETAGALLPTEGKPV